MLVTDEMDRHVDELSRLLILYVLHCRWDREGEPFDFHGSNITVRLSQHGNTFMKHR